MLVIFPPAGIPMYLKDEFGPSRKIRKLVCVFSALWFIFLIWLLAFNLPAHQQKQKDAVHNEIFETPKMHENRQAVLKKSEFATAGNYERAVMIENALGNHLSGDSALIKFDDGTAIDFPAANIHVTGTYGVLTDDGDIFPVLGTAVIKSSDDGDSFVYTAYKNTEVIASVFMRNFPEEYASDASDVQISETADRKGFNVRFIITLPEKYDDTVRQNIKNVFEKELACKTLLDYLGTKKIKQASVGFAHDSGNEYDDGYAVSDDSSASTAAVQTPDDIVLDTASGGNVHE